jgi:ribokinase
MTIVCLGDVFVDVLARLPGPLQRGSDTPAPVTWAGGGAAANTAAWIAAAGGPARLIGCVGADLAGDWLRAELVRYGLDLQLRVDPSLPTGTCLVLIDPDGERTMVPSAGASLSLRWRNELLGAATAVHVSGYALFGDDSREAAVQALAAARSAGVPVSLDAASAGPLARFGPHRLLDAADAALVFANRDEAALLIGSPDIAAATAARRLGSLCGEAVVKDGAAGAAWSDGTDVLSVPAVRIDGPVDSTGAGDAFAAGVLGARAGGASIADQLARGAEFAGRALACPGGRPPGAQERV